MTITEFIGIPQGHRGIDFVDIDTAKDTLLFIDPCLIDRGEDELSKGASSLISDFSNQMYGDMRSKRWTYTHVFDEAHEVNDTHLGYGNGRNGKGKTPEGMRASLNELCNLANEIPPIKRIQDVSVLVEDFAEDCMSDLLTNILHELLSQFTAKAMAYYQINPAGKHQIRYWDDSDHCWATTMVPYWAVDGRRILLVPKWWVRKHFLFTAHQYLCAIIIERMRNEHGFLGLTKKDIWRNIERKAEHWEYEFVIDFTREHPDSLDEYHSRMFQYYNRANGCMDDDALDQAVYGHLIEETA